MLVTSQNRRAIVNINDNALTALTIVEDDQGNYGITMICGALHKENTSLLLGIYSDEGTAMEVMQDIAGSYLDDLDEYIVPADPGAFTC